MSNKSQYEDRGLQHRGSCYTTLNNTWKYSCPHKNVNFVGFSGGVNCLCVGMPTERSSGDKAQISGKAWPKANPGLGWKK